MFEEDLANEALAAAQAKLAANRNRWLSNAKPTVEDAEAYVRGLTVADETYGAMQDGACIPTITHLWAWCRCWQERFQQQTEAETIPFKINSYQVPLIWEHLRILSGGPAYPAESQPPTNYAEAIRALDLVVNWCGERMAGLSGQNKAKHLVLGAPGERPIVRGVTKEPLTDAQCDIIKALEEAGPRGLTKDQLDKRSGHTDARKILGRLVRSDADWASIIVMAGKSHKHYRLQTD